MVKVRKYVILADVTETCEIPEHLKHIPSKASLYLSLSLSQREEVESPESFFVRREED